MLVVFLSLVTPIIMDPCVFTDVQTLYSLSDVRACFDSIPLEVTKVGEQTVGTLMNLSSMYVFKEMAVHPIYPYNDSSNFYKVREVDIDAELVKINASLSLYACDFDFHNALSGVYLPLKDPHTRYDKPRGYGYFYLILPVTVSGLPEGSSDEVSFTLRDLSNEYGYATWQFNEILAKNNVSLHDFFQKPIKSINGIPTLEALQMFADDVCYVSKNPHARLNSALARDFFLRPLRQFQWPGSTNSPMDTASYTFVFADGSELVVPLYVLVSTPMYSTDTLTFYNYYTRHASDMHTPHQTDMPVSPMVSFTRDTFSAAGVGFSESQTIKPYADSDYDDGFHFASLLKGKCLTLEALQLVETNEYLAFLLTIPDFAPSDIMAYVNEFAEAMTIVDSTSKTMKDPRLIVNLIKNGGGYITLGYRSLHVLAPHVNPTYGRYTIRKSPLSLHMASNKGDFADQPRYDLDSWVQFRENYWYTKSSVSVTYPSAKQEEFSDRYTFDLAYDELRAESLFVRLWNIPTPSFLVNGTDKLAFITDGCCGSTCATFAKRASESRAGVWFGVGGNPTLYPSKNAHETVDMDVASFAGGSVLDTDYLFAQEWTKNPKIAKIVSPLPSSALHRFAFEQLYSWNVTAARPDIDPQYTPLEYVNNPVDDYLTHWFSPGSEYNGREARRKLAISAYNKLSTTCYDSQKMYGPSCQRPDDSTHVYGYACGANGVFDKTQCIPMQCRIGFVQHPETNTCTPQPPKSMAPLSGIVLGAYIFLGIVAVGLTVLCISFFTVRFIRKRAARKQAKLTSKDGFTLLPQDSPPKSEVHSVNDSKDDPKPASES